MAATFAIFTLLVSALYLYLNVYDWRGLALIAFFLSSTIMFTLGAIIEQFKVKHWSLSYLAILSIISSFMSFFLLEVSMLGDNPFGWVNIVGWMVFTLPFVINASYNLFNLVRAAKNVPLA